MMLSGGRLAADWLSRRPAVCLSQQHVTIHDISLLLSMMSNRY